MARLLAGVGRVDITPPVGVDLAGYPRRAEPSQAIQSPLLASTLAVGDGRTTVVLVTCDLIFFRAPEVDALRAQIAAATGIPAAQVTIACSHTHSSPNMGPVKLGGTIAGYSMIERAYHDGLRNRILESALEAVRTMVPVRIALGTGECDLAINRRERLPDGRVIIGHNPDGPVDYDLTIARFDRVDGAPLAAIVHYTCHPTVLGPDSRYIGPDYVGPMRAFVERNTDAMCLFLQGAAGNVAPKRAFAASLDEPERFGRVLGADALAVWYRLTTQPVRERAVLMQSVSTMRRVIDEPMPDVAWRVQAAEQRIDLALGVLPTIPEARRIFEELREELASLERRRASAPETNPVVQKLAWATAMLQQIAAGGVPDRCTIPLTAFSLGDQAVFATIPGEPFVELQLALKRAVDAPYVLCVAYANGCVGYIPSPESHEAGGYEVTDAHKLYGLPAAFHPDSQDRILATLRSLIAGILSR